MREQIYKGRRKKYLKSDEGKRDIPLTPAWVDRLAAHHGDTYQGDDSPVFASAVGTPLVPGNVYRRVLAPAAIDAGLYVQVGPDLPDAELQEVLMRSGRRHLAPVGGDRTLCGRKGTFELAGGGRTGPVLRDLPAGSPRALAEGSQDRDRLPRLPSPALRCSSPRTGTSSR